jgi:peptide deformylase
MRLPFHYYGDPVLRTRCLDVREINDEIRTLVSDMIETMDAHDGMGLAAPQIGKLLRLFVIRNHNVDERGYIKLTTPQAFINPQITIEGDEFDEMTEGCLSIPGIREMVRRPFKITVEAMDEHGKTYVETREGLDARVVLHENDHINGVLFIDRIDKRAKKRIEPLLRNIKKKYDN